jgi:repressor LexA
MSIMSPHTHPSSDQASDPSALTDRQQAIYAYVRDCVRAAMPPTYAEIATAFGFQQPRAAQKHLQAIANKGWLRLLANQSRGIRLTQDADADADANTGLMTRLSRNAATKSHRHQQALLRLPLVGRVAAGAPILAAPHIERELLIDPSLFKPQPDFLLRVHGDSMRDVGILDRDWIAVQRTAVARSGQIVIARIDEEITVKRLEIKAKKIRLLPENSAYPPIIVQPKIHQFAIEGLYVGVIRSL